MPSIAHLILGGIVGLCFYYLNKEKFTKTHVFIFFLCNYLGPDVGWVLGIGYFTHSLVFWPFFALLLAFFYHYFTRFTIKIDGIKNIEIIDLEGYKLHYVNTYLLVLGAGILHNYLDGIMNKVGEFRIIPQLTDNYEETFWTLNDLNTFGQYGILPIHFLISIIVGVSLIFGFVFLFIWFLKKSSIKKAIMIWIYILVFVIFFYLAGSVITVFHPDGGAIIYISIFWASPLILCVLSTKEFNFIKRDENGLIPLKQRHIDKGLVKYILIIACLSIFGLIMFIFSVLGIIYHEDIVRRVYTNNGDRISEYFSYSEFNLLFLAAVIFQLVISIINIISAIGLASRNKYMWKFAVYSNLIFSWTIIGLTIACALNETSVKKIIKL
ncbi:MAG: hypothetical protein ACTSP6_04895 [Promethearchaeota archaeon]